MTTAEFRKLDVPTCNETKGCSELVKNALDAIIPSFDVNAIDYDIEHDKVGIGQLRNKVQNISNIMLLIQRKNKTNRTGKYTLKKEQGDKAGNAVKSNAYKYKLLALLGKLNSSNLASFDELSLKTHFKSPKRTPHILFYFMNAPLTKHNLAVYAKSKTSNIRLDDLMSKYVVVKKRSINKRRLRREKSDSSSIQKLKPLKRSDGDNHDSFTFFGHSSNEKDIDPVSSIFDKDFLFGGSETGFESTTPFPIVDKDYDYNAEYEFGKANSDSNDEMRSEETYEEEKKGNFEESLEEPASSLMKPKENSKFVINVVKQEENQESSEKEGEEEEEEEEEEEGEEDEDVIKEPPIIVLYKGGDSKQLQPSFEYALTHGDFDPRYLTKDPLAGPLATRGFNHNFQVMRQVPIQGNVMQPGRRYPTVGGFNTTQIHAIIQAGQLPTTTTPGSNNSTIGVAPPAPADHVSYARPMGQVVSHPYPANSQYTTRPIQQPYIVRPNYYGGRGRRPSSMVGPIRSPSAFVYTTSPRYRPPYRGGYVRYTGNRNHMARYRPINVGIPRGTRVAVLTRRESTDDVEHPLIVHAK